MKLYFSPGTCALACWISLKWANATFEVEKVNPKSEEYKKINPLGMVPTLDIGGPRPMTQTDAILQYIAEKYQNKNLGSDATLEDRFEFNETMSFLTGDFHPAFWPFFSPSRYTTLKDPESIDAARKASYERVDRALSHLDQVIMKNDGHAYHGRRTVADAYAFVMIRWSEKFPKTWTEYKHLSLFMNLMAEDKDVKSVLKQST